jgi:predicted SprT family Zn-dependent metalloprotease
VNHWMPQMYAKKINTQVLFAYICVCVNHSMSQPRETWDIYFGKDCAEEVFFKTENNDIKQIHQVKSPK